MLALWTASVSLTTTSSLPPLPTINNFRDLGGMACANGASVKPCLLLRSADLETASPEDLTKLKGELPGLRIVDLRGAEDAHNPGKLHEGPEIFRQQLSHIEVFPKKTGAKRIARHLATDRVRIGGPLLTPALLRYFPKFLPGSTTVRRFADRVVDSGVRKFLDTIQLSDVYWWILMEQPEKLAEVIRLTATQCSEGKATLIHCAHGKDRTGVVIMLLLHICGVSPEAIATDYSLSGEYGCSPTGQSIMLAAMPGRFRERIGSWANVGGEDQDEGWKQFGRWCDAEEATMLRVIARLEDKYGSVDAYLEKKCGIFAEERASLATTLTTR